VDTRSIGGLNGLAQRRLKDSGAAAEPQTTSQIQRTSLVKSNSTRNNRPGRANS
jgi:hypothetical protein